jgi:phage terminase large subunit-like protein
MEGVIFEKLRQWAPRAQLAGGSWDKAYDKTRRRLNFANGSQFSFMTFEQDLDKFGGRSLDRVHYDEEPPEAIRKECRARLDRAGTDELFTMTPLQGMTWMYDGVYERRYENGVTVVEVATDENPHVDQASMAEFFASLTDEEREARQQGKFVHFGGLVLSMWRDELHLVDEVRPDHLRGQDVFRGIDPGWARGGVIWGAFDRDDVLLIFDELYPSKLTVGQIAEQIKERDKYWGLDPDDVVNVIDPSGRNMTQTGEEGPEAEYRRHGIYCIRGQNSRRTGIMQLRRRLGAERPKLRVARNCRWTLWERGRWRVAEDEESHQDVRAKNDRGQDSFKTIGPDHLWDPIRYVACQRPWGPIFHDDPRERNEGFNPEYEGPFVPSGGFADSPPLGAMS